MFAGRLCVWQCSATPPEAAYLQAGHRHSRTADGPASRLLRHLGDRELGDLTPVNQGKTWLGVLPGGGCRVRQDAGAECDQWPGERVGALGAAISLGDPRLPLNSAGVVKLSGTGEAGL